MLTYGLEGGVVKRIIESGGNGVCWADYVNSYYGGRQFGEHRFPFLWGWEEVGVCYLEDSKHQRIHWVGWDHEDSGFQW